jgi:anti-sigma B factor antagonist
LLTDFRTEFPDMNVTLETAGSTTLARLQGRLDFAAAAGLQQQLEQAVAAKPKALVIDCAGLDYVSSAGLRVFLVAARAAKAAGVGFAASALSPSVREVFEVSGFNRIIDTHADAAAALAALG